MRTRRRLHGSRDITFRILGRVLLLTPSVLRLMWSRSKPGVPVRRGSRLRGWATATRVLHASKSRSHVQVLALKIVITLRQQRCFAVMGSIDAHQVDSLSDNVALNLGFGVVHVRCTESIYYAVSGVVRYDIFHKLGHYSSTPIHIHCVLYRIGIYTK